MVVVFTSSIYTQSHEIPISLLVEFILPGDNAIVADSIQNIAINVIIVSLLAVPIVIMGYQRMIARKPNLINGHASDL
ncbi:MAG: hypothetical protein ACXADL_14835 [Candidatus Thorarchaeota archaeon]